MNAFNDIIPDDIKVLLSEKVRSNKRKLRRHIKKLSKKYGFGFVRLSVRLMESG